MEDLAFYRIKHRENKIKEITLIIFLWSQKTSMLHKSLEHCPSPLPEDTGEKMQKSKN